jgi:hypothetical protein
MQEISEISSLSQCLDFPFLTSYGSTLPLPLCRIDPTTLETIGTDDMNIGTPYSEVV